MKKTNNNSFYIVLIVILSVVTLGLIALLVIGVINKGFGISIDNVSTNLVLEREFELEDLEKINVKAKAGNITVRSSKSENAVVKFYADKSSAADVSKSSNALIINDKSDDCRFICLGWKGVNIEVYLPEEFAGDIKTDLDSGRTVIEDFRNASFDVNSDMGDVNLGSAKNIFANLDMGKLTVADCYGKITVANDMGDVEIKSLHLTDDSEIKLDMGSLSIDSVGDVRVDAEVDLGDKDISGGNYKSDIVLKLHNSMGSITVH